MRLPVLAVVVSVVYAAGSTSAHHSYSAYDLEQVVEIDGVLEEFAWINPHSLLKMRTADALYTIEWRAPNGLLRLGLSRDMLKAGERLVVTGNPHRDIAENGVVNLKSIRRVADDWTWPAPAATDR